MTNTEVAEIAWNGFVEKIGGLGADKTTTELIKCAFRSGFFAGWSKGTEEQIELVDRLCDTSSQ